MEGRCVLGGNLGAGQFSETRVDAIDRRIAFGSMGNHLSGDSDWGSRRLVKADGHAISVNGFKRFDPYHSWDKADHARPPNIRLKSGLNPMR